MKEEGRGQRQNKKIHIVWAKSNGKTQYWLINDGDKRWARSRSKTLINYLYLPNETTLILVSRSDRKQADSRCGN